MCRNNKIIDYFLSDINECENGEADCAPHSECVNVQGAYYCQCEKGFWDTVMLVKVMDT